MIGGRSVRLPDVCEWGTMMTRVRFRAGFGPEGNDMAGLIRMAKWSDGFFNYIPAEQAYGDDDQRVALLDEAKRFVEANPECPYTAECLADDFLARV